MEHENQPLTDEPELQIVLIGNTKVGKSATGNTILGKKAFKSIISDSSVTQECQIEKIEFEEQNLAVIDTPGLFGTRPSDFTDEERPEKVMKKIKQSMLNASPGPVMFLVVLQLGGFSEEERKSVEIIQSSFGEEAAHYTMALFTRGDDLQKEGRTIEEFIGANPTLRDFIRACYGAYHVFDNGGADLPQVKELLQKINRIVQRNGDSSLEWPKDEGVLVGAPLRRKIAQQGQALRKSFVNGAIVGACVVLFNRWNLFKVLPKYVLRKVAMGAVTGGVAGAARYVIHAWIW